MGSCWGQDHAGLMEAVPAANPGEDIEGDTTDAMWSVYLVVFYFDCVFPGDEIKPKVFIRSLPRYTIVRCMPSKDSART